ncbi:hypothetical protein PAK_03227 [Pseudomonas aeruginosa PAK]|nr:hypothetical protein PAK_03227 [Pseudomonas aeruginosa PAK]
MLISDAAPIDRIGQDSTEHVRCGMQSHVPVTTHPIDLRKNHLARLHCSENGCLAFNWDMQDGIPASTCFCPLACIGDPEPRAISQRQPTTVSSLATPLGIENGLVEQQAIFNDIGDSRQTLFPVGVLEKKGGGLRHDASIG